MKINLNKINLTKEEPSVEVRRDPRHSTLEVNLQWNQGKPATGFIAWVKRLLGMESPDEIDLDLGAFVRMKDGSKHIIQALGKRFGSFTYDPYTLLLGDDLTGENPDGEWLRINGKHWSQIDEIYIYAFIYDGVASWEETDGSVTIHIPGTSPIEVKMTGESNGKLCAVAKLTNVDGAIKATRLVTYHPSQRDADAMYGWGLTWTRGRK